MKVLRSVSVFLISKTHSRALLRN